MPAKRFSLLRTALGTTVVLLALPLAGNLVSAEVHWSAADFFIAGCLFLSVSVGVLTIWRSLPQRKSITWIILLLVGISYYLDGVVRWPLWVTYCRIVTA